MNAIIGLMRTCLALPPGSPAGPPPRSMQVASRSSAADGCTKRELPPPSTVKVIYLNLFWDRLTQTTPLFKYFLHFLYSKKPNSSLQSTTVPVFSPLLLFRFLRTTVAFWSCSCCEAEAEAAAELQSCPRVPTVTDMERWNGRPRGISVSDAGDSWCEVPYLKEMKCCPLKQLRLKVTMLGSQKK